MASLTAHLRRVHAHFARFTSERAILRPCSRFSRAANREAGDASVLPVNLSIEIGLSRILNVRGYAEYRSFRGEQRGKPRKLVIILRKSLR